MGIKNLEATPPPSQLWAPLAKFQIPNSKFFLGGAALLALGVLIAIAPPLYAGIAIVTVTGLVLVFIRPEIGLYLLAFSVPFQSLRSSDPTEVKVTITEGVVALAVSAFLVRQLSFERGTWRRGPLLLPMAVFMGAMLLSVFKAQDQLQSLKELVKWLEFITIYWVALNTIRTPKRLAWFLVFITLAALTEVAIGAAQVVLRLGPPEFLIGGVILRAYGTFGQPNPFAGYLNLVLPILLGVALFSPNAKLRFVTWLAVIGVAGIMVTTLSRGAWLGFAVALLVIGIYASQRLAVWIWIGLLGFAILIFAVVFGIVPFSATERLLAAFGLSGVGLDSVTQENFSAVQRLAFWQAGFNMFISNPVLGVGIGNYIDQYPLYAPQGWDMVLGHAHDYYLNAAAETGLVGLAGYLALLVVAFRQVAASVRSAPPGVWFGVALGLLGSLTAISVHNLVDNMYVHGIPVLLGLLLGCSAVIPLFKPSNQASAANG